MSRGNNRMTLRDELQEISDSKDLSISFKDSIKDRIIEAFKVYASEGYGGAYINLETIPWETRSIVLKELREQKGLDHEWFNGYYVFTWNSLKPIRKADPNY